MIRIAKSSAKNPSLILTKVIKMAKEVVGECKLCKKESKLCYSHIIPEFMYHMVYDRNPTRFYEMKIEGENSTSKVHQKGIREYLLCASCESKLSIYEKYADDNIYGKNNNAEAIFTNEIVSPNGTMSVLEIENINYSKFKLFLDSLLWRFLISEKMVTPKYHDEVCEDLRRSLLNEVPLPELKFPCMIRLIKFSNGDFIRGKIICPYSSEDENVLSVFIDGIEFNYYINNVPQLNKTPFISLENKLKMIGMFLNQIPRLHTMLMNISSKVDLVSKKKKK